MLSGWVVGRYPWVELRPMLGQFAQVALRSTVPPAKQGSVFLSEPVIHAES